MLRLRIEGFVLRVRGLRAWDLDNAWPSTAAFAWGRLEDC